jgi:hypothetical protein
LLAAPGAALLVGALRANSSLTHLALTGVDLWRDPAAAVTLLGSLAGHPSLKEIDLEYNFTVNVSRALDSDAEDSDDAYDVYEPIPVPNAVSGALAALLSVDSSALETLILYRCGLDDDTLGPIVDALAHNTHLRALDIIANDMSDAFARGRLLRAVRANTSLHDLQTTENEYAAVDAVAHVATRGKQKQPKYKGVINR